VCVCVCVRARGCVCMRVCVCVFAISYLQLLTSADFPQILSLTLACKILIIIKQIDVYLTIVCGYELA